ncbi:MAG: hypothetical protein L6R42_008765 [Xanthoria sp. 1 TBL-2021]|nr:MAG: hypothetical protein L6R42_008765 [Xanthoria sp. 1 TBL-2021]
MSLIKLPRETRSQIYSELLAQHVKLFYSPDGVFEIPNDDIRSLARVCHQIHEEIRNEFLPKLYSRALVCVTAPGPFWHPATYDQYLAQLELLDPTKCSFITHLIIQDNLEIKKIGKDAGNLTSSNGSLGCPKVLGRMCQVCRKFPSFCDSVVVAEHHGRWAFRYRGEFEWELTDLTGIGKALLEIDHGTDVEPERMRGLGLEGIKLLMRAYQVGRDRIRVREAVRRVSREYNAPQGSPTEIKWV